MTKEELAKRKGIKIKQEKQNPAASLLTTNVKNDNKTEESFMNPPKVNNSKTSEKKKSSTKKEPVKKTPAKLKESSEIPVNVEPMIEAVPVSPDPVEEKRSVGRPKSRKEGGKQMSFFLDPDLIEPLYKGLGYRDSYAKRINDAIRWYVNEKGGF